MTAQAIATLWNRHTESGAFSGAILLNGPHGDIFSARAGLANRDFSVPITLNTLFDTASVTKVFTTVAVLQLVQQGHLALDTPIHSLINLTGTAIHPSVTIHHLLSHTSGIADDADEEAGEDYADLFAEKPNYTIRNCVDFLPNFVHKPARFTPGTDVRYSNCAFILLGLAIEALTKQSYREYVTQHIFMACGLSATAFYAKDEIGPNAAEGYFAQLNGRGDFVTWKKNIYSYPPIGTADSGAYSTPADLVRFFRMLQSGILLNGTYTQMLLQPQVPHTRPHPLGSHRYGYAFEFLEAGGRIRCLYKEGVNAGVFAMLAHYPKDNLVLAMLSNQDGPFWPLYNDINRALLKSSAP